ncbi:MAG: hypothetical protein H3C34_07730 [Caldilineaceae bacterium]|nr:hypothetical protein [Caldilineaceae bacterium]
MYSKFSKLASILAFVIGAMAIFAGGQVLLGRVPTYYVIDWLPIYNFTVGAITFFYTAIVIWRDGRYAVPAAGATLALHSAVMAILLTVYRDVVAGDSLVAMTVRIVVWVMILTLLLIQSRKTRTIKGREQNV